MEPGLMSEYNKMTVIRKKGWRKWVIKQLKLKGIVVINNKGLTFCKNRELEHKFKYTFGVGSVEIYLKPQPEKRDSEGFIYIIGNILFGYIKIGFSVDPAKRILEIQTGCPFALEELARFKGTIQIEKALHKKYQKYKSNGEWFRFEGKLKEALAKHIDLSLYDFTSAQKKLSIVKKIVV